MDVIAVVCAGAGARGAYEAGALSVLLPWLIREYPRDRLVMVGTSAGAINTALFSAVLDDTRPPEDAVEDALALWRNARSSQVIRPLFTTLPGVTIRYGLETLGLDVRVDSLLDTAPLHRTLQQGADWTRLDENLGGRGRIHAAGVAATHTGSGRTTVFLEGRLPQLPSSDPVDEIDYRKVLLRPPHVLASSAIPVAFPPVQVTDPGPPAWYVDGGVRLNAPIKPALALGAQRVAVVATTPDPDLPQSLAGSGQEPDVFAATAVALRSVLVDRMAQDVRHLREVNELLAATGKSELTVPRRTQPYRDVANMYIGPSEPGAVAQTAQQVFDRYYRSIGGRLSDLGLLASVLGGVDGVHGELFSFLFFDGRFHEALIEMGRADATRIVETGWREPGPSATVLARAASPGTGVTGNAPRRRPRRAEGPL